jgi:hypothetical protein
MGKMENSGLWGPYLVIEGTDYFIDLASYGISYDESITVLKCIWCKGFTEFRVSHILGDGEFGSCEILRRHAVNPHMPFHSLWSLKLNAILESPLASPTLA